MTWIFVPKNSLSWDASNALHASSYLTIQKKICIIDEQMSKATSTWQWTNFLIRLLQPMQNYHLNVFLFLHKYRILNCASFHYHCYIWNAWTSSLSKWQRRWMLKALVATINFAFLHLKNETKVFNKQHYWMSFLKTFDAQHKIMTSWDNTDGH